MKKNRSKTFLTALLAVLTCALVGNVLPTSAAAAAVPETADADAYFSERDLAQTADLSEAVYCAVSDGEDIHIEAEGVYVLTGSADDVTVYVEAPDDAKVQLVLDGVRIANSDAPCICVATADKVFVTTSADSTLEVSGAFAADAGDGAIFSRSDLVLNGTAALTSSSAENGVVGKDDVKITGGTYAITATGKAIAANDSIRIADGSLTLNAGTDGLHAENNDDDTLGWIYIGGGTLAISARDDGIHANSLVQIDDGNIAVSAAEGIEGTYVRINGGVLSIQASDDGINAGQKSSAYRATIEINGGEITVAMGAGDTDGIDSNGDIYVNGGTISVTAGSSFDYDGSAQYTGGTIIVNGQQIDSISNPMMGGAWGGAMGGSMGGRGGFGR